MKYNKNMAGSRSGNGPPGAKTPARNRQSGSAPREKRGAPSRRQAAAHADREELVRSSVRKNRTRHRKNYMLYYILLLLVLAATGITLSLTVFFNIETIQVAGNGHIDAQSLISVSRVKKGDNLFRISTERAARAIVGQYVEIDRVSVSRKLPDTLAIQVELAKLMAVVKWDNHYYSVSHGGRIIAVADKMPALEGDEAGIPLVVGCDFTDVELGSYLDQLDTSRNKLDTMKLVLDAIDDNSMKNIGQIDLEDVAFIKLYYEDRVEIKMGGVTDFTYELSRVKQLLKEKVPEGECGVLDATLRNGSYYYRETGSVQLPGSSQSTPSTESKAPIGHDMPGEEALSSSDGQ